MDVQNIIVNLSPAMASALPPVCVQIISIDDNSSADSRYVYTIMFFVILFILINYLIIYCPNLLCFINDYGCRVTPFYLELMIPKKKIMDRGSNAKKRMHIRIKLKRKEAKWQRRNQPKSAHLGMQCVCVFICVCICVCVCLL